MKTESAIFIRLDKIGDLVSTLPCDELAELKKFQITWFISSGLGFIARQSVPPRSFIELDKSKAWKSFWILLQHLKKAQPSLAISFQAPWWVSLALWMARVPKRVGRLSQWHSFLFFNRGLRQKRSQSLKHEADYNAELVAHAFDLSPQACAQLKMKEPSQPGLLEKFFLQEKNYFVVHPGMAGSALNWPIEYYVLLINNLLGMNQTLVVTGTAGDEPWLSEIKRKFASHKNFRNLQNQLSPQELLTVLANAQAVLAPSTGVLHLAASLGTFTVGIYSSVLSQRSVRWRARGPFVKIFEPPEQGSMTQISVEEVQAALLKNSLSPSVTL